MANAISKVMPVKRCSSWAALSSVGTRDQWARAHGAYPPSPRRCPLPHPPPPWLGRPHSWLRWWGLPQPRRRLLAWPGRRVAWSLPPPQKPSPQKPRQPTPVGPVPHATNPGSGPPLGGSTRRPANGPAGKGFNERPRASKGLASSVPQGPSMLPPPPAISTRAHGPLAPGFCGLEPNAPGEPAVIRPPSLGPLRVPPPLRFAPLRRPPSPAGYASPWPKAY